MTIGKERCDRFRLSAEELSRTGGGEASLFGIAAASAVMTMKAQSASGAVLSLASTPLSIRLVERNRLVREVHREGVLADANLAPMYPHPGDSLRAWQVYGALLILLAITMLVAEA